MNVLVTAFQKVTRIPEATFGVTEDEVRAMVTMGHESGSFEKDEKEMIERVFLLNDITAEDVMTPSEYFVSFDLDTTLRDALPVIMESGYSRFPVEKSDSSAVEGIIYTKDVFAFLARHEMSLDEATKGDGAGDSVLNTSVAELMKPPVFVPATARIDDLLKEFQKHRKHIAIVVDAHGSILGLATLEDLLEEIVGEIIDESDVDEATIRRVDKETIEIDPRITIGKVNTFFNSTLKGSRQKTVGWLVLKNFGRIPEKGDSVTVDDYKFIVEEADERRIKRLLMIKTAKARARERAPKTE
jgi:CBS domain containing-hemolysin-like protein